MKSSISGRRQPGIAAGFVAAAALAASSCFLFPTETVRDLRAAWSPDGSSLLIVTSRYATTAPRNPYYYDPSAFDYRLELSLVRTSDIEASGWAAAPRVRLAEFAEANDPGGLPQYAPAYWLPDAAAGRLAVFGGRDGYGYLVDLGRRVDYAADRTALAAALGPTDAWVAADLEKIDIVPDPAGAVVAVLWHASYFVADAFGPMVHFRVVSFHAAASGALLRAVRPTAVLWYYIRGIDPYRPLASEAASYAYLAWKADGSGVYVPLPGDEIADSPLPGGGYPIQPDAAVFVPAAADGGPPYEVAVVPPRPVQTASGPVAPDGRAVVLVLIGPNGSRLDLVPFPSGQAGLPGWTAYGDPAAPSVPAADWASKY
jgi:hypothetical protein